MPPRRLTTLILAGAAMWYLSACDSNISGELFDNLAPNTELSVRDTSLVENLEGADRLASTVNVSWSGVDPDGFVASFEIRVYDETRLGSIPPEEGWSIPTTSLDTLILLPIPLGDKTADVVFEARAIDNVGLKDPSPARTIFPVVNSPPTLRLSAFDVPPDESFTVFSFGWSVFDPEGEITIDRIEISLNDSVNFVHLPGGTRFATFIGEPSVAGQEITEARVYTGRGFVTTDVFVPGLRLDAENTFYIRAVDQTDTTSTTETYEWDVKEPNGQVLFVNDYRKAFAPILQDFHLDVLREYLPEGTDIEIFNISEPFLSGATSTAVLSSALPSSASPTLEQTYLLFDYIYWISTGVTATANGSNLAFSAPALNSFFAKGGKFIIHAPVQIPTDPAEFLTNPAISLLPLTNVVSFPDSLRPSLRLPNGGRITPVQPVPGPNTPLPALVANRLIISTLPYIVEGTIIPLYEAEYTYRTRQGGRTGPWFGSSTVASISADRRVGLVAIPFAAETDGSIQFDGADGSDRAVIDATHLVLESLGFPKR
ncbi:MAG: hypothetical protein ACC655_04275 [Rhodothermia bacterium]